jgi:predicted DNA-binding protein
MKTAISMSDELYEHAEVLAESLGIPRSQLYARALEEYLERHQPDLLTKQLNRVYGGRETTPAVPSGASLDALRELTKNDTW